MAIKLLRSNSTTRASSQRVLDDGQPLYEKDTNKLYVGDGTTQAKNLSCVTTDRLKTSKTRPEAEVKSGTGTVTKEIALLEDIPQVGEWKEWSSTSVLTEEGLYEIVTTEEATAGYTFFVQYEKGKMNTGACWVGTLSSTVLILEPSCSAKGKLSVKYLSSSNTSSTSFAFKYRKIH